MVNNTYFVLEHGTDEVWAVMDDGPETRLAIPNRRRNDRNTKWTSFKISEFIVRFRPMEKLP